MPQVTAVLARAVLSGSALQLAGRYTRHAFFRPAVYEFRLTGRERNAARAIAEEHGTSAQDFFKHYGDKSIFFSASGASFLAYRVGANQAIALGGPVGPSHDAEATIAGFTAYCKENTWDVAFHQVHPEQLELYERLGFRKMKIGEDAIVDLSHFSLKGKGMKEFRNTVTKLEKAGVRVERFDAPVPEHAVALAKRVSDEWLRLPGRRERRFTLGMFEPGYVASTPLYIAFDAEGRALAFLNLAPSYREKEASVDLMRRCEDAPNGIVDFVFAKVFLGLKEAGYERVTIGMAPMCGFQAGENPAPEERLLHWAFRRLNFIFSFEGIRKFKAKYANIWEPRYIVYRGPLALPRVALALRQVSELHDQAPCRTTAC